MPASGPPLGSSEYGDYGLNTGVEGIHSSFLSYRFTKRQPVIQPHHQVSFASIIKSQESERSKNRYQCIFFRKSGYYLVFLLNVRSPQKALSLIQIEERAISELEKAYCATDNPDEVIVVERCSKDCQQVDLVGPVNFPWAL